MSDVSIESKKIIDLEVHLNNSGLSDQELDAHTRRLARKLRQLPHKSVGIQSKQLSELPQSSGTNATQGRIALSLPADVLPEIVKLFREETGITVEGPNHAILKFGSVTEEEEQAWLNAVAKQGVAAEQPWTLTAAKFGAEALPDVNELREHARRHVERGAVTEEYGADRQQVIAVLNEVLATELVCVLRYKSHYYRASGLISHPVKAEFLEHAQEAQQHADQVATRIVQLNGAPDFSPEGLASRSRSEFRTGGSLREMIKEDLIAERIAVEFYTAIIRWLGDSDLTTRKVMQDILAVEAQHAEDMKILFDRLEGK